MNIFMNDVFHPYYSTSPLVLVDVGAKSGLQQNWLPAEKYLKLIGFEPNKVDFEELQNNSDNNQLILNIGLHNKKTSLDLHVRNSGASIYKPNEVFLKNFYDRIGERNALRKTIKMETDTLDNQFQINHIDKADFIKLDTDGSELFILQGAEKVLEQHIFGLEIEVQFADMFRGGGMFRNFQMSILMLENRGSNYGIYNASIGKEKLTKTILN